MMNKNWKAAARKFGAILLALMLILAAVTPAREAYALEEGDTSFLGGILDAIQTEQTPETEAAPAQTEAPAFGFTFDDGKKAADTEAPATEPPVLGGTSEEPPTESGAIEEVGGTADVLNSVDLTVSAGSSGQYTLSNASNYTYSVTDSEGTAVSGITCSSNRNRVTVSVGSAVPEGSYTVTYSQNGSVAGTFTVVVVSTVGKGTFDHIEIEVTATATLIVDGDKELEETFTLTLADLRGGNTTITCTYDGTEIYSEVWDDADIVTGDGSNNDSTIELTGSYPAGTKDKPYYYTIEIVKSITFTDEDTGNTYTVPVTLSVTTSYWDPINACPGLGGEWSSGGFSNGAGIDVPIGGDSSYTSEGNIQLTKVLDGVEADSDVTYTFAIYQKVTAENGTVSYKLYDTRTVTIDADVNGTTAIALMQKVPVGDYIIVEVDPDQDVNDMEFEEVVYSTEAKSIEVTVDGQTTTVTGGTVEVELNETSALTVTNVYAPTVGNLNIVKNVEGLSPSGDETFTFTVTPGDDVDADDFASWAKNAGYEVVEGAITVEITVEANSNTNTMTLEGLPAGKYTVLETGTDIKYEVSSTEATVDVSGQATASVTVTNTRKTADVTLNKIVSGNMGDQQKEFTFTVTLSEGEFAESDAYTLSSDKKTATVYLKHGETVTFADIPVGATISVTESDNVSYEVTTTVSGADDSNEDANIVSYTVPDVDTAITYDNYHNIIIDTGVGMDAIPYFMILAVCASAVCLMMLRKRMTFED